MASLTSAPGRRRAPIRAAGSGGPPLPLPLLIALFSLSLALKVTPSLASISTLGLFGQQQAARNQSIKTTTTCAPVKRLQASPLAGALQQAAQPAQAQPAANQTEAKLSSEAMREIASQLGYAELGGNKKDDFKNSPGHDYNGPGRQADVGQQEVAAAVAGEAGKREHKYKLPSWFNYELYKRFFGKSRSSKAISGGLSENETHKRIYLRTALRVFEQQALYRAARTNIVSSINELSDLTSGELLALKARRAPDEREEKWRGLAQQQQPEVPECCTYEQLYTRIIELLNKTSNAADSPDLTLSRALLDGLEQKPLLQLIGGGGGGESNQEAPAAWEATSGPDLRQQQAKVLPSKLNAGSPTATIGFDAGELQANKGKQFSSKSDNSKSRGPAAAASGKMIEGGGELDGKQAHHRLVVPAKGPLQQSATATQSSGPNEHATLLTPATSTSGAAGSEPPLPAGGGSVDKSLARAIEDSVKRQVVEQLSGDSPLARQLRRQFSAYFGQPVVIKATIGDNQPPASSTKPPTPASYRSQPAQVV